MTANAKAPSSGWTITGQRETVQVENGVVVNGVTIDFLTGNGVQGSVFVPNARYTTEYARTQIMARAQMLDDVHNLSAEPS
jgi:hypothetical protein